jgi:hypothetical protein
MVQATSLPPWQTAGLEPKRKFKYILLLGDLPAWIIKTSGRPNINVSEGAKHNFMAYEFKFPGRVTWDNISVTLVDPIDFDAASGMLDIIEKAGYKAPSTWAADNSNYKITPSKRRFVSNNLGTVRVQVLNGDGVIAETWTLNNTWVSKVEYDDLDYSAEDLLGISLTLVYDWADLEVNKELITIG